MIQLLEKKTGVRIIVFTLLLTILAWLVPSNIGQANAETKEAQTITVNDSFNKTYGDSAFDLQAIASGTLTYESNNRQVATVSDAGIVTITGVGTATITIRAAETDTYASAEKLVRVTVEKGTQTITGASSITKNISDTSFSLDVSAPGSLSFASSDSKVATITSNGRVTITGAGTTTITVTAEATNTFNAATKYITLTVEKMGQTLSGPSTLTKTYGDSSFDLGVTTSSPGKLTYTSSNPKVATVNTSGRVAIIGAGVTTITVTAEASNTMNGATKTVVLTVEKSGQLILGNGRFLAAYGDSPFNLNQRAEGTLTYESKNPELAAVGSDGTVTILGVGTAEIQITAAATENYKAQQRIVQVIVEKGKQTISGATSFTKNYGNSSFSLGASAEGELSYESSNPSVASVSSSGTVTIKGPGTATIIITAAETDKYQKATKQVKVTVKVQKPKTVAIKSAKSSKEGQLTVSWKKVSGVSGYQVVLGKNKSCTSGKKVKTVSSKTSSLTVKGLAKGTKYYAKVRAYKTISGKKYYGNYSKVKSAKIKGVKPKDLKAYQNKQFWSSYADGKEYVYVRFEKASGKKIKLSLSDGIGGTDAAMFTETTTGTLSGKAGNKIKFTVKRCEYVGEVNGGLGTVRKPAKLSGVITLVNSKTVKLKITSKKDPKGYYESCKFFKVGKTATLKLQ